MIHQPAFDIPNFERVTTEKLTHYYAVGQRAMNELQRRHDAKTLTPHYKTAEAAWHANDIDPTTFPPTPLTVEVVNNFYAKCDAICEHGYPNATTPGCVPASNILSSF